MPGYGITAEGVENVGIYAQGKRASAWWWLPFWLFAFPGFAFGLFCLWASTYQLNADAQKHAIFYAGVATLNPATLFGWWAFYLRVGRIFCPHCGYSVMPSSDPKQKAAVGHPVACNRCKNFFLKPPRN
jgi:hypothetical protein